MKELNKIFDCFIVGSDQVWRYSTCPDVETFFLNFVEDSKIKISYAASFGIDTWNEAPDSITIKIKKLLKKFDAISVRPRSRGETILRPLQVGQERRRGTGNRPRNTIERPGPVPRFPTSPSVAGQSQF